MVKTKPKWEWRRVGKTIFSTLLPVLVIVLFINSFRFGWWGFIVVSLLLLALAFFMNKEMIMNTAELVQVGLWGRHMTLQELKGKKVKFVFGRGKKHGEKKDKKIHKRKRSKDSKGNESCKG